MYIYIYISKTRYLFIYFSTSMRGRKRDGDFWNDIFVQQGVTISGYDRLLEYPLISRIYRIFPLKPFIT